MKRLANVIRVLSLILGVAALVFVGAALPVTGCSDDDPVTGTCNTVCGVADDHPCKGQVQTCLAECNALGVQARDRGFQPDQCASCLLGMIEPSGWKCKSNSERCLFGGSQTNCEAFADCETSGGNECFGFNTKSIDFMDPKCLQFCFQPDAGVPHRGF